MGRLIFWLLQPFPRFRESCQVKLRGHRVKSSVAIQFLLRINGGPLVHRLISGRHTVGCKRVWMLGMSEERIRCDT
jgi:hypothetical protein